MHDRKDGFEVPKDFRVWASDVSHACGKYPREHAEGTHSADVELTNLVHGMTHCWELTDCKARFEAYAKIVGMKAAKNAKKNDIMRE